MSISQFPRYFLVVLCFLAISSNVYSFYYSSKVKEHTKTKKEQKASKDKEDGKEELRYCAYEALIPVVHFNIAFLFCFIIKGVAIEAPAQSFNHHSPPFFTRPFYKTLFRMIISPNAP